MPFLVKQPIGTGETRNMLAAAKAINEQNGVTVLIRCSRHFVDSIKATNSAIGADIEFAPEIPASEADQAEWQEKWDKSFTIVFT